MTVHCVVITNYPKQLIALLRLTIKVFSLVSHSMYVSHSFTIYLPDILFYTQDRHTQVHVRLQVVVSRVPTSVITMMEQPIRRDQLDQLCGIPER